MTHEEAEREVRYAARRFYKAVREDYPVRVTNHRYRRVYRAMNWARKAGVDWREVNRIIKNEEHR